MELAAFQDVIEGLSSLLPAGSIQPQAQVDPLIKLVCLANKSSPDTIPSEIVDLQAQLESVSLHDQSSVSTNSEVVAKY